MLGFLGYVGVQVMGRSEIISNRYSAEVQAAMEAGDFEKAKTHFSRIMLDQELSKPQKMRYIVFCVRRASVKGPKKF